MAKLCIKINYFLLLIDSGATKSALNGCYYPIKKVAAVVYGQRIQHFPKIRELLPIWSQSTKFGSIEEIKKDLLSRTDENVNQGMEFLEK